MTQFRWNEGGNEAAVAVVVSSAYMENNAQTPFSKPEQLFYKKRLLLRDFPNGR